MNDLSIKDEPQSTVIYQKDNNLDGKDNLNQLPHEKAVYAIFGRINNKPANCRYVGITENLQIAVKNHFSESEDYECLKNFMRSIKIKELVFELLPSSNDSERELKLIEWKERYQPNCNDKLNEVY